MVLKVASSGWSFNRYCTFFEPIFRHFLGCNYRVAGYLMGCLLTVLPVGGMIIHLLTLSDVYFRLSDLIATSTYTAGT